MALSLSNVKRVSAALADTLRVAANRRGFAAAATQGGAAAAMRAATMKEGSKAAVVKEQEDSWVPDPVTGYYRPENRGEETDVAELREMLLSNKKKYNNQ